MIRLGFDVLGGNRPGEYPFSFFLVLCLLRSSCVLICTRFEEWCADQDAARTQKTENEKKRKRVLARPITAEDIETQSNHLHYVHYAGHVCMMYYTKARGGVT